jgi:hypothetical protein
VLDEVNQHLKVERALARKVGVDRAAGQLGALSDAVDLRIDIAVLGELFPGRVEHRGPSAFLLLHAGQPNHAV